MRAQGAVPRASTAQKTRPEGDSAGALRRARRNADRRTSRAIHASRVCFAQLPHCPVRQHARSGHGTVLPRVVLIAGRPTLQSPRRSPGVYWNLEPSSTRASIRVPCPSHGPPGRLPRPTWSTFQTRFDGREASSIFCVYAKTDRLLRRSWGFGFINMI